MRRFCWLVFLLFACDGTMVDSPGDGTDSGFTSDAGPQADGSAPDGSSRSDASLADGSTATGDSGVDARVPAGDDGLLPRIMNFRVEDGTPDRLYFESSEAIQAADADGFVISGKTIASVNVVPESGTGHYFTVTDAFTFWDNNLIRYEGGGDLSDREGNPLHPFLQVYVENQIPEPLPTGTAYHVSVGGNDSADGLGESSAWRTLSYALSNRSPVEAGDIVHVKAGDYGTERVVTSKNSGAGPSDLPIIIAGYENTPGDDPDLGWSHPVNTELDASVMPLFRGTGQADQIGFTVRGDNLIFKNFQITRYGTNFSANGPRQRLLLENVIVTHAARRKYGFLFDSDGNHQCRLVNTVAYNAGTVLYRVYGTENLIENATAIQDEGGVDYYIVVRGDDNIVRHSYMEHAVDAGHGGHGISVKSVGVSTEHGLYEDLEIVGIKQSIEVRHDEVRFNYYHRIIVRRGEIVAKNNTGGIVFSNGANQNTLDAITVTGTKDGITFVPGTEDDSAISAAHSNLVINSVFAHTTRGIRTDDDSTGRDHGMYDNRIVHSVFFDMDYLYLSWTSHSRDNMLINSHIIGVPRELMGDNPTGFASNGSNYYDSWGVPPGTNSNLDPHFMDTASLDFHLGPDAPAELRAGVLRMEEATYDREGSERSDVMCAIGAYAAR